jgi:hypothetical protein
MPLRWNGPIETLAALLPEPDTWIQHPPVGNVRGTFLHNRSMTLTLTLPYTLCLSVQIILPVVRIASWSRGSGEEAAKVIWLGRKGTVMIKNGQCHLPFAFLFIFIFVFVTLTRIAREVAAHLKKVIASYYSSSIRQRKHASPLPSLSRDCLPQSIK